MSRVAVLIPAKNCERFLPDCLKSLTKQTYKDFSCHIVYGASNDNTKTVIDTYTFCDSRFRVITGSGTNLASDLNLAMEHIDSEFIVRLDSDDLARPFRIEKQLLHFDEGFDILGSNVRYFDSFRFRYSDLPLTSEGIRFFALYRNPFAHPSVAFRRKLNLRYDPNFDGVEDYELWVRCLRNSEIRVKNIATPLTNYRIHKSQITKSRDGLRIRNLRRRVVKFHCETMGIQGNLEPVFFALANQSAITLDETLNVLGMITSERRLSAEDRMRLLREIVLSTVRLGFRDSLKVMKAVDPSPESLMDYYWMFLALFFSSGPLSRVGRFIRLWWA
jgi:glycosyltransferase involved in cell wall biosynthesis